MERHIPDDYPARGTSKPTRRQTRNVPKMETHFMQSAIVIEIASFPAGPFYDFFGSDSVRLYGFTSFRVDELTF